MNTFFGYRLKVTFGLAIFLILAARLSAQTCLTAADMDAPAKTALLNAAQSFFDSIARGDSAALRLNAIPSLAGNFSGIETAVMDNQNSLSGAKAVAREPFLLKAEGSAPLERAEFLCGVFGPHGQTTDSAVFVIPNLPPGDYGFVTQDVTTPNGPYTVSYVLQQAGGVWKLAGLYIKPSQAGGQDGNWFAAQARELKAKGANHAAWLYFQEARDLLVPVPFMSTLVTDKLYDEAQAVKPADLPPSDLVADGKTLKLTALFPLAVGKEIDLVLKYQSTDISNSSATYQENVAAMKALLAKYPELRATFAGIIARAVEPSGRDYGTMLHMKDIK